MEAVEFYETLLSIYQSEWRTILTDHNINSPHHKNFKSLIAWTSYSSVSYSTLMMEAADSSETLVPINLHGVTYQEANFNIHRRP
jgi:hypothetical protein